MMSPYGIATHFVICRRLNIPSPESAHDQECIVFSQYDQVGGKGKNKLLIYPSLPHQFTKRNRSKEESLPSIHYELCMD